MMRYIHSILLPSLYLLLIVSGCKKEGETDYEQRHSYYKNITGSGRFDSLLTVVTYNVQCGFEAGKDPWSKQEKGGTPEHINRLADIIKQSEADIVMLQEVPYNRYNTEVKDFLSALANTAEMNYAFGAHGYNDPYGIVPVRGQWGNAVLSKYTITEIENVEVARTDVWRRRSVLRSRLKIKKHLFIDCYSLHHFSQFSGQEENTVQLFNASGLPKIVGGDFNNSPDHTAGLANLIVIQKDSIKGIDHILISSEFNVLSYGIVPGSRATETTLPASDHEAIFARIKLH